MAKRREAFRDDERKRQYKRIGSKPREAAMGGILQGGINGKNSSEWPVRVRRMCYHRKRNVNHL